MLLHNRREYVRRAVALTHSLDQTLSAKTTPEMLRESVLVLSAGEQGGYYLTSESSPLLADVTRHLLLALAGHAPRIQSLRFLTLCVHMGGGPAFLHSIRANILRRVVSSSLDLDDDCLPILTAYVGRDNPAIREIQEVVDTARNERRSMRIGATLRRINDTILVGLDAEDWSAYNSFFKNRTVTHSVVSYLLCCAKEGIVVGLDTVCARYMSLRPSMHRCPQLLVDTLVLVKSLRAMNCDEEELLKKLLLHSVVMTCPLQSLVEWVEAGCCVASDNASCALAPPLWNPPLWNTTSSPLALFLHYLNPGEDDLKRMVAECAPSLAVAYGVVSTCVPTSHVLRDIIPKRWELWDKFPVLDEAQTVLVERLRAVI